MLDKQSPIPLYYQLAERIKDQIHAGALAAGDQLPPERDLAHQMGVSRMTARQALGYLVNEGLLEVRQGVGTFLTPPKLTHNAIHLVGFTEEMRDQGGAVTSTVLEQAIVSPPVQVARRLALLPGTAAIKITRLRQVNEIPLLLETSYLPAGLCPGLEQVDLTDHSLYGLVEARYQLHPYRTTESVEATIANQYEQRLLQVPNGAAMLLLEGVTYSSKEEAIEYFKAIYRGDRFKFALESRRTAATGNLAGARWVGVTVDLG